MGLLTALILLTAINTASAFPSRPASGVVDESKSLSNNDRVALQALLSRARAQGEDIAVAIVNSVDGAEPRKYATDLFNAWGLGRAKTNRGILVLVAVQDRAAELILGSGIDGPAEQAISERIMQDSMVPEFRAGRYAMGAIRGAERAAAEILRISIAPQATETAAPNQRAEVTTFSASDARSSTPAEAPPPEIAAAEARQASSTSTAQAAPLEKAKAPTSTVVSVLAVLIVIGMVVVPLVLVGVLIRLAWVWITGNYARRCRMCGQAMQRLNEIEDDQFLGPSERMEEKLGSMNYHVWRCTACQNADKVAKSRWFSSYKQCPACKAKTLKCESRELSAASYSSTGVGEITEHCQACAHHDTRRYVIAVRVRTPSSSSSSGGSSSGGGASGRW